LFLLTVSVSSFGSEQIVFTGIPEAKISEGGVERLPEQISSEKAMGLKCTITEIDGKYYWTTRENLELVRVQSGAYVTFLAQNGSGYVRIIDPSMKKSASLIGGAEAKFDYVGTSISYILW
jgi:hypothetical protein